MAVKAPESWNICAPCGDGEKVSVQEKTIQDPGYTAAEDAEAWRDPGKMSLSHTHVQQKNNTHTSISQLYTDETPTARHPVMTHAIIAFPPAVIDNTENSGVHHYGASSRSYCRVERVSPKEAHDDKHNSRNGLISHSAMGTKCPLMNKWKKLCVHTMDSTFITLVSTILCAADSLLKMVP